jgi:hypothetical protein
MAADDFFVLIFFFNEKKIHLELMQLYCNNKMYWKRKNEGFNSF